jgi:predicted nucleic acid-binding protein
VLAHDLLERLAGQSLRTLDALHLAIAHGVGTSLLATADRKMARAAEALGMATVTFG